MQLRYAHFALVLGALSAIGPISVDLYLPALPTIAADLRTDAGAVQMSVVVMFVALAAGQPVYGPLVDMFGRRLPMMFGLLVFTLSALVLAFVSDVDGLVWLRFVQGLGICGVPVAIWAMVRDRHTGAEAARLIAIVVLILGVSPVVAPLAGSFIVEALPWRAVFVIFALAGLAGLALVAFVLPETLPREKRVSGGFRRAFAGYGELVRDSRFMGLTLVSAFGSGAFFAYIASSAFFFMEGYGLDSFEYSLLFALNAAGIVGLTQFNAPLIRRFGAERLVMAAVSVNAAASALLLAATLLGVATLPVASALLFLACSCFGLTMTPIWVLAIDDQGERAGTASALMGTLQFGFGAAAGALVSVLFDGTTLPMVAVMGVAAIAALALTVWTLRLARPAAVPAEAAG